MVREMIKDEMKPTGLQLHLLHSKQVKEYITKHLQTENLKVVWEIWDNIVYVHAYTKENLDGGMKVIKTCEENINFAQVNKDLLETQRWRDFKMSFESQYGDRAVLRPSDRYNARSTI